MAQVATRVDAGDLARLREELAAARQHLQFLMDERQASEEELRSANEEILSSNEELQSTNEELQTSKEELESANEELNTVNEEMQHRNMQLTQANNDLLNLLASVNIPLLLLDAGLSIRRMTPQVEDFLGITTADLSRPIQHLRLKINIPNLERTMLGVIQELQPRELLVRDGQNRSYRLRVTPYRTMDNHIEGVVLAFVDQTGIKQPAAKAVGDKQHPRKT